MLTPRKCSNSIHEKYGIITDEAQNEFFLLKDKAFFYNKFYLDVVK